MIGVDLAKAVFQLHATSMTGQLKFRKKLSRWAESGHRELYRYLSMGSGGEGEIPYDSYIIER
jgi:hypothetical protein